MANKNNNISRDDIKKILQEIQGERMEGLDLIAEIKRQLENGKGEWVDRAAVNPILARQLGEFVKKYDELIERANILNERNKRLDRIFKSQFETLGITRKAYESYRDTVKECEEIEKKINFLNYEKNNLEHKSDKLSTKRLIQIKKELDVLDEKKEAVEKEIESLERKTPAIITNIDKLKQFANVEDGVRKSAEEVGKEFEDIGRSINDATSKTGELTQGIQKANIATLMLKSLWKGVTTSVKESVKYYFEVEDATFKTARAMGMNREQAQDLTKVQLNMVKSMGKELGLSRERADAFQKSIAEATGKNIVMTKQQYEAMAEMGDLATDEIAKEWTENFGKFGASLETTRDIFTIARSRAKVMGLDAQKATTTIAKNIGMLHRYTFREGVNGLTKMALRAQELKTSMESAAKISDSFGNIEDAITNSAKLQMLGGAFTAMYSNPMGALYEGMTDPQAAMERAINAAKASMTFDRKTGMVTPNGTVERMRLAAAANVFNMSPEEFSNMVGNALKGDIIEKQINKNAGFTKEQISAIKNLAGENYNSTTGKHYINTYEGGEVKAIDISTLGKEELERIQRLTPDEKNSFKDISDIRDDVRLLTSLRTGVYEEAKGTQSSVENYQRGIEQFKASVAKGVVADPAQFLSDEYNNGFLAKLHRFFADNAFLSLIGLTMATAVPMIGAGLMNVLSAKMVAGVARGNVMRGIQKPPKPEPATVRPTEATPLNEQPKKVGRWAKARTKLGKIGRKGGKVGMFALGAYGLYSLFSGGKETEPQEAATPVASDIGCDSCTELQKQTALLEKIAGVSADSLKKISALEDREKEVRGALEGTVAESVKNVADTTNAAIAYSSMLPTKALAKGSLKMGSRMGAKTALGVGKMARAASPYAWGGLALDLANIGGKSLEWWDEGSLTDKLMNVGSDAATGAGLGASIGSIGGITAGAGAAVGAYLGTIYGVIDQFGEDIVNLGKTVWDKSTDYIFGKDYTEEEIAKSKLQHNFEQQKLGPTDIADPAILQKAAYATIGIHDLLISKFNTDKGLKENGDKYGIFENEKGSKFNPLNWFSRGGIAKAAGGMVVPGTSYIGDKVPALLNSREMILNYEEQRNLFNLLKRPFIEPIPLDNSIRVAPSRTNNIDLGTFGKIGPTDINLNVSGTIRLEGSGAAGSIDFNQLLRNEQFKRELAEIIKGKLNESGNVAKYNKESNHINTTKMYVGV